MKGDINTLIFILKRKRRGSIFVYVALLNISVIAIFISSYYSSFVSKLIFFVACCVATIALFLISRWLLEAKVTDHPAFQLINDRPQDVVWVYWLKTENMPFGVRVFTFHRIYLNLNDHSFLEISVRKDEVEDLLSFLKERCSRAVFGYSKEREQLYKISPDLIAKDPD